MKPFVGWYTIKRIRTAVEEPAIDGQGQRRGSGARGGGFEGGTGSELNIRRPNIQLPEYSGIFTKNSLSKMGHFVNIQ
mgnify:CR=1 FL=1